MNNKYSHNFYERLTEREQEVLQLILKGNSNPIIASDLYITIGTLKRHICNIINKLNADDDGNPPSIGAVVPRKPLPSGDGNVAVEELSLLLEQHLL
jgi:DNA-binding NarL/FixJ family response regulator